MRKLLAALLVLPFLASANAGSAVPAGLAAAGVESLSITTAAVQPALPGHTASSAIILTAALESASPDSWRAPVRTLRGHAAGATAGSSVRDTRTLIARLQLDQLAFRLSLARTHVSEPATLGNPPPVSRA